ncbi:hypothetical protein QCD71_20705 [Sphingomonas sp. PsM26]|nr:hypothetical protein [Sphingomonas sp. PsM26]
MSDPDPSTKELRFVQNRDHGGIEIEAPRDRCQRQMTDTRIELEPRIARHAVDGEEQRKAQPQRLFGKHIEKRCQLVSSDDGSAWTDASEPGARWPRS